MSIRRAAYASALRGTSAARRTPAVSICRGPSSHHLAAGLRPLTVLKLAAVSLAADAEAAVGIARIGTEGLSDLAIHGLLRSHLSSAYPGLQLHTAEMILALVQLGRAPSLGKGTENSYAPQGTPCHSSQPPLACVREHRIAYSLTGILNRGQQEKSSFSGRSLPSAQLL